MPRLFSSMTTGILLLLTAALPATAQEAACCMPYGACIVVLQVDCESNGGTWDGSADCTSVSCEATASVVINEIRINQTDTDNSEYFELYGTPGLSLFGLTYIVVGDAAGDSGRIETLPNLSAHAIPSDGYFVAAEDTFEVGLLGNVVDYDVGSSALGFENDDNVTHMLVAGFAGGVSQDLDTNNDGSIDVTPWTAIIDLVAIIEEGNPPGCPNGDYHYGPPTVGPAGSCEAPWHVYRDVDGPTGVWQMGVNDPLGETDTPGLSNFSGPIPTVSEWGLLVMGLLLLTSGTLVLRSRRAMAA